MMVVLAASNAMAQNPSTSNAISVDSGFVTVDRGKLFYQAAGKGANIVLLHDGMVPCNIWDEQFLMLAKSYRVVRYDRRGYGKSTDPDSTYSHIEDLNQVFLHLNLDRAIIFGMSSGGGLAIDFTLQYPAKVRGLVLVGAVVGGLGYTSHMINRGGHLKSPKDIADPAKAIAYLVNDDPYEIYHENVQAKEKVMKIMTSNPKHPGSKEKYAMLKPPERTALGFLSEIIVPTLILAGEFDIPDVHAHAGAIDAGIANSTRRIIPGSGHLIPIEQPGLFNAAVIDFLEELSLGF
jgi:pimeloyl-ACP methyl ester carboxylesterase